MNILIRNYDKDKIHPSAFVAVIELVTTDFADELDKKKNIRFDDKRLQSPFNVIKQPNGNLCIQFDKEETK